MAITELITVTGRGPILIDHDAYATDYQIGQFVTFEGKEYQIVGIEAARGMVPLKGVGLVVRPVLN